MGTWGAALYDDDQAGDLKTRSLYDAKLLRKAMRSCRFLKRKGAIAIDEGALVFWLVVADQFERRGVVCPRVVATALSTGFSRSAMALEELRRRLVTPRPHQAAQEGRQGSGCRSEWGGVRLPGHEWNCLVPLPDGLRPAFRAERMGRDGGTGKRTRL